MKFKNAVLILLTLVTVTCWATIMFPQIFEIKKLPTYGIEVVNADINTIYYVDGNGCKNIQKWETECKVPSYVMDSLLLDSTNYIVR